MDSIVGWVNTLGRIPLKSREKSGKYGPHLEAGQKDVLAIFFRLFAAKSIRERFDVSVMRNPQNLGGVPPPGEPREWKANDAAHARCCGLPRASLSHLI
jgi:hypothetical protein